MKVRSFIRQGSELVPVEVEINLLPGLPQISFLGLPDAALKESSLRIRSALREQGFHLPQAQQIVVHLKPTHLRKSSRGLDLAVAAAILWETEQLEIPEWLRENPYFYGELSLKGEVVVPDDLPDVELKEDNVIVTGALETDFPMRFRRLVLRELKELFAPEIREARTEPPKFHRPVLEVDDFPELAARLITVVAAGEHATLIAGAPGSGKSTVADAISSFLDEPDIVTFQTSQRVARAFGRQLTWRPLVRPHHSITPTAMIGGGINPWPGEISRAHGGVLVMDELLEFHPDIQEALREPIETGIISIARGGHVRNFPARFLLLATTNLCPCGEFTPTKNQGRCRCSRTVRARALQRLTGPFVDRFAIFTLTDDWSTKDKPGTRVHRDQIRDEVNRAIFFRQTKRAQNEPNSRLTEAALEKWLGDFQMRFGLPEVLRSRRRRVAILRVARTLADLRESEKISNHDLDEAAALCVRTHSLLQSWRD